MRDIFDTLEDTGEDFDTTGEELRLFSIYQFRQLVQEEEESYDDYE